MNAPEVQVRQLLTADATLFREIRLESLQCNPEAYTSSYEDERSEPLSVFEDELQKSTIFGAFQGDELLGIAALSAQQGSRKAHKGILWAVYVRANARNIGVGRKLIAEIIAFAKGRFDLIQLNVNTLNQAARRLYETFGFRQYGIEKCAVKDKDAYTDNVLMVNLLKAGIAE